MHEKLTQGILNIVQKFIFMANIILQLRVFLNMAKSLGMTFDFGLLANLQNFMIICGIQILRIVSLPDFNGNILFSSEMLVLDNKLVPT